MSDLLIIDGDLVIKDGDLVLVNPPDPEDCECCQDCLDYTLTINYTPDDCCCFAFSVIMDPPGTTTIASYSWNFGDGSTSTSANPTHCYEEEGSYLVTLTTVDAEGCQKITTVEVACECLSTDVVADFSYEQTDADPCCFQFTDESVANCPGRTIVEWLWDFGDGTTSTLQNPTKCYAGSFPSGPWNVTLTATDSAGCSDAVLMSVACQDGEVDDCCGDTEFLPATCTVVLSGFGNTGLCSQCATQLNTSHTVPLVGVAFPCNYVKDWTFCGGTNRIRVQATTTFILVQVVTDLGGPNHATFTFTLNNTGSCRGTFSVPATGLTGSPYCSHPGTNIQVTI
jgi:hypothetical protein